MGSTIVQHLRLARCHISCLGKAVYQVQTDIGGQCRQEKLVAAKLPILYELASEFLDINVQLGYAHTAATLIHFPAFVQVHTRMGTDAKDGVHLAMQKQSLDDFQVEKVVVVVRPELIAGVPLVLKQKRRRSSILIRDYRTLAVSDSIGRAGPRRRLIARLVIVSPAPYSATDFVDDGCYLLICSLLEDIPVAETGGATSLRRQW